MMEADFVEHFDTSLDRRLQLLNDQRNCDLFFIVGHERQKFGAHKHILKGRSTYFNSMFSERWPTSSDPDGDSSNNEIVEENYQPEIFRSFLEHIYGDVFSARPVEAVQLLALALFYGVPSLVQACEELLAKSIRLRDLLQVFVTARKYFMWDVMTKTGDTMAYCFKDLTNSPTFENADEATLKYFLERDDLKIDEAKLFIFLVGWADKQLQNSVQDENIPKLGRKDILKNLLPLIRFLTMNPKFAQDIALTDALPSQHERDLLNYFMIVEEDKEGARAVASRLPYSSVPRKNNMVYIDFYGEKPRPGKGIYQNIALEKRSNVQDILTVMNFGLEQPKMLRIVSLVLEPPKYGKPLFQNSSEVAALNLPIRVGISCSLTDRLRECRMKCFYSKAKDKGILNLEEIPEERVMTCKSCFGDYLHNKRRWTWSSKEVIVKLTGTKETVLELDEPWILSYDNSYIITTRFLSDVYTVPQVVDNTSSARRKGRDEDYDFFTATKLRQLISPPSLHEYELTRLTMSGESCSGDRRSSVKAKKAMSSGLHLIRSIRITEA